jgi:hypothetical protein
MAGGTPGAKGVGLGLEARGGGRVGEVTVRRWAAREELAGGAAQERAWWGATTRDNVERPAGLVENGTGTRKIKLGRESGDGGRGVKRPYGMLAEL